MQIALEEGWYLWPIPFVDFKDNDFNKISVGMDLRLENFQGINDDLRVRFGFGYNPEITISYILPYIWTHPDISFESATAYGRYKNLNKDFEEYLGHSFDQKTVRQSLGFGYRLNLFSRIYYYTEFIYNELPSALAPITENNYTTYRLFSNAIKYWYDSRDLKQYPKSGNSILFEYYYKFSTKNEIHYSTVVGDLRFYKPLPVGFNYRMRLFTRQSIGNIIPSFDLAYIGFTDYVRGNYKKKLLGRNSYLSSIELTHDIVPELIINYDLPYIPKALQTFRTQIVFEAFFDAGTTANSNKDVFNSPYQTGLGFGIVFLALPYDLLRIEYAFDRNFKPEFKIDLGLSF